MPWLKSLGLEKIFGKSSADVPSKTKSKAKTPVDSQSEIQRNRDTIDRLEKKIMWINKKNIAPLRVQIKELMKQNTEKSKNDAKRLLKRSKLYQNQITNMENQLYNLENVRIQLESSTMTREVFDTMASGTQMLKNELPDADRINNILADTEESLEQVNEVTEMLSRPINNGMVIDDDELEDELMELAGEGNGEPSTNTKPNDLIQLPDAPKTIRTPNAVPKVVTPEKDTGDAALLNELSAFANGV